MMVVMVIWRRRRASDDCDDVHADDGTRKIGRDAAAPAPTFATADDESESRLTLRTSRWPLCFCVATGCHCVLVTRQQ